MAYLKALKREMEEGLAAYPTRDIQTVFVGGGTPSALSAQELEFFLQSVRDVLPIANQGLEWTLEANPESTDETKLSLLKEAGVNRLSFGVQAFQPDLLKRLGRLHTPQDIDYCLEKARAVGLDNLSIDLMFGLPGQTMAMVDESLTRTLDLDVPHVSAYGLNVEPGTHFDRLDAKGRLVLPPEEDERRMYDRLMSRMRDSGYRQYEISNFARPGYESRHNITYWRNREYYGFGAGAHGYVRQRRYVLAGPLQDYIDRVEERGFSPVEEQHVSDVERMEDFMIMGLRMLEGVSKKHFLHRYGKTMTDVFGEPISDLVEKGLLYDSGDTVRLTERGIPLGNEVFARFL